MRKANTSIFRAEALNRYRSRDEKSALPKLVSPRVFQFLWVLLGLLLAGAALISSARIPVYASGVAVIVESEATPRNGQGKVSALIFLPPESLPQLKAGQPVFFRFGGDEHLSRPIMSVEPQLLSPLEASRRFALSAGAAARLNAPKALAVVSLEPSLAGHPASTYAGSFYDARVEIGSRRVASLAPWANKFFGR